MLAGYVFLFLAFAVTVAADDPGGVYISGTVVTLTCPLGESDSSSHSWYKEKQTEKLKNATSKELTFNDYDEKNDGWYHCEYDSKHHHFYIKAKVCEGCVEMDMILAFGIIFGDVMVTLGVVLLIYCCFRNKDPAAAPQRAAKQRQARGARGPPVPDADYQTLNQATRSNDIYSQAHR